MLGVGGGIFPLCFGIVRDEFPRDRVGSSIGPDLGDGRHRRRRSAWCSAALLIDHTSYHWIFWLGAAMAVVAAVTAELFVPESPVRTPGRVDVRGARRARRSA